MSSEPAPTNETLIAALKEAGMLYDPRLEAAFRATPRHHFLPDVPPQEVYADDAVAIKRDIAGTVVSSSSQPSMMAIMLDQLQLEPGHNVLEIGTGTGYNAAIMRQLVGEMGNVTTIEIDKEVARAAEDHLHAAHASDVLVVHGDGAAGYAPRAAYDRIIATVGVWDVPRMWFRQLKPTGRLVTPLWLEVFQVSAAFMFQPDGTFLSRDNPICGFVQLRGGAAGPDVTTRVGSSPLTLSSSQVDQIDTAALHLLLSEGVEDGFFSVRATPREYWHSFFPYLILHAPPGFVLAGYYVTDDQQPYGIESMGFALLAQGSACFVPVIKEGEARCFAGSDAFMAIQDVLEAWDRAGRPGRDSLRLRLIPIGQAAGETARGKLLMRRDHALQVWLDDQGGSDE
jgi:protein-L-isoaspartate(D-aspartate) O-methyltransferase